MRWRTIPPLVVKDLVRFARNPFFGIITLLYLGLFIGIYFILPATVDEQFDLGLYAPDLDTALIEEWEDEGVTVQLFDSEDALRQAVEDEEVDAGLLLPDDLLEQFFLGERPTVRIHLPDDATPEMAEIMTVLVENMGFQMAEQPAPISRQEEVLGPDLAGEAIPQRDRMIPLIVTLILMIETLGLAVLLSDEIETGVARALLVTPMSVTDFFVAKGISGVFMAFAQVVLVLLIIGALAQQTLIVLTISLLGAILVTGIGFLIAAPGWDIATTMALGFALMIPLSAPPFDILFPGSMAGWARLIPTHYMSPALHHAANIGLGWGHVWQDILILLGFCILFGLAGVLVLKSKFR